MTMGFSFSQGAIDFLVFNVLGRLAQKARPARMLGPRSENMKPQVDEYLRAAGAAPAPVPAPAAGAGSPAAPAAGTVDAATRETATRLLEALGERVNVREVQAVAHTRLRVTLADPARFDEAAARLAGVMAVMRAAPGVLHLIVGEQAGVP